MRTIERTKAFHRDWKKVSSGVHGKRASGLLQAVAALLVEDRPLPTSKQDHQYRKPNPATLQLVRLGSHSDLVG